MNVLSLDGEHIVVQDIQIPLIRDLEKNGFTPIPSRPAGATAEASEAASTASPSTSGERARRTSASNPATTPCAGGLGCIGARSHAI